MKRGERKVVIGFARNSSEFVVRLVGARRPVILGRYRVLYAATEAFPRAEVSPEAEAGALRLAKHGRYSDKGPRSAAERLKRMK